MTPEFSVVIPTYARAAYLAEAVESVLRQTEPDLECIVVDDASPEPPSLPSDPRVRLVSRANNGGPAAARNTGIAAASGRFLAFLDDDDVWVPNRLALAIAAHPRADVAICWQSTLGDETNTPSGRILEGDVSQTVLDGMTPHLGATTIERSVAPMFDERYEACEDVDWWLRVAQQLPVATTPEVGLLYRAHTGDRGRTGLRNRLRYSALLLEENEDWFRRHPKAEAFRLKRLGLSALKVDERALARRSFLRSLRLHPESRTAWHALRSATPRPRRRDV